MGTLKALRAGEAPFDVLSPAERAEQIAQLVDAGDVPIPVRLSVKSLPDARLIEMVASDPDPDRVVAAAAELTARMDAAPDPDERRRIEAEDDDYHRELTLRREADEGDQPSPYPW